MAIKIQKILIANNSLPAQKFITSLKEGLPSEDCPLFYGMVTESDLHANMRYIDLLDGYRVIPSGPSIQNYGNVHLIVDIALEFGVDAVWPGWGHASENSELPALLAKTKAIFMGPTAESMSQLGDKIKCTRLCELLGIKTIPNESIKNIYSFIETNSFPVIIKASNSGGGKGIRILERKEDIEHMIRIVESEAGVCTLFVSKLLKGCRHIEIQCARDTHGYTIIFGGRDCTIQRRHQKMIEECPPTIVENDLLKNMEQDCRLLLEYTNYIGLATVEFLYDPTLKCYYFLEINTRTQVEHPVTELVYGINIPMIQYFISSGQSLKKITIDNVEKHAIGIRITAEDKNFNPVTGNINVSFESSPNSWGYFSMTHGAIHEYSDSQFGHIFCWGKNRHHAISVAIKALHKLKVENLPTPKNFLLNILKSKEFQNNIHSIDSIKNGIDITNDDYKNEIPDYILLPIILALNKPVNQIHTFKYLFNDLVYNPSLYFIADGEALIEINKIKRIVNFISLPENKIIVNQEKILYRKNGSFYRIQRDDRFLEYHLDFDRSIVKAPSRGKIVRYSLGEGSKVEEGKAFGELESMKVNRLLLAPVTGILHILKNPNSFVEEGEEIVRIETKEGFQEFNGTVDEKNFENIDNAKLEYYTLNVFKGYRLPSDLWKIPTNDNIFDFFYAFDPSINKGEEYKLFMNVLQCIKKMENRKTNGNFNGRINDLICKLEDENILLELLEIKNGSLDKYISNENTLTFEITKSVCNTELALIKEFNIKFEPKYINVVLLAEELNENMGIFFYDRWVKYKVYNLIVNTKDGVKIHYSYVRGLLEEYHYNKNGFVYKINSTLQLNNNKFPFDNIPHLNDNRLQCIRNRTIYYEDFIYLFQIYFIKKNLTNQINEIFLKKENNKYLITKKNNNKCIKIGIKGFDIKYGNSRLVIIINDITHKNGSFSKLEGIMFCKLSKLCRRKQIHRIYIACNSGARIGIFENLKKDLFVQKGNGKLELSISNSNKMDSKKYKIHEGVLTSIYGNTDSGPENLSYSSMMARETVKAYEQIFTLTYVSGISVGIGSYLARLGRRVIQKVGSSILLTGFKALNKLVQQSIYNDNEEIGGYEIMGTNGVTHKSVINDFEGVCEIMEWVEYVNSGRCKFSNNTVFNNNITNTNLSNINEDEIIELITDLNSYKKYLSDYAPNVNTGRAKINGISIGIISSAVSSISSTIPSDDPWIKEKIWTKNVMFKETAHKIALSIEDFDKENLDILIIANWKGFSGGRTDMSSNVLDTGSLIIRNLARAKVKVFVYVPPCGQLRGGTWVVFDKKISPRINMIAHPKAEVGILQPDGMAEIKFKEKERREIIERSGMEYQRELGSELAELYCKLHDSIERMAINGSVDAIITVEELKNYLYNKLK
ncbi:Acetyl-CoA carboxylase 2 [Astathelohania contejeani]|uniref:Acetyl-CoA carboxylase 2 n=1 Tax=Astathelohania contejeani TaxID=164912 RepID=A0ABQ7I0N6_9MICR|nr:Acetyl-CoA carboxylase 2 [Thelohania contejeani]